MPQTNVTHETVLSIQYFMILVRLRAAMEAYRERTGIRLTYDSLAEKTGMSPDTLQSLASRNGYNTRLTTIEKLCRALECVPGDILELSSIESEAGDEN